MLSEQEIWQVVDNVQVTRAYVVDVARAIERAVQEKQRSELPDAEPIDMVLYCPNCGMQHVDRPNRQEDIVHRPSGTVVDQLWTNPPHRSHMCRGCACVWRPADVPTNGVAALQTQGKADTWPAMHNEEVRATPAQGKPTP